TASGRSILLQRTRSRRSGRRCAGRDAPAHFGATHSPFLNLAAVKPSRRGLAQALAARFLDGVANRTSERIPALCLGGAGELPNGSRNLERPRRPAILRERAGGP